MSDESISVPQGEHPTPAEAVVDAIEANLGIPPAYVPFQRAPNVKYNSATDEVEYFSDEDRRIAEAAAPSVGTLDDRDLSHELETLGNQFAVEADKLNEKVYDPNTGAASFRLAPGTAARIAQEKKVCALINSLEYQQQRYAQALANRKARDAANARANDGAAIGVAWTAGDPRRQAILDKAIEEAEARHVADAMIRARLGNLGN